MSGLYSINLIYSRIYDAFDQNSMFLDYQENKH